mmetsp:Transcript_53921/g.89798  ORF Transcript_53921/g.89798 Transcript_53921/m.89798 type:complete len:260 (+) Transcript_53921:2417-3196(+)
MHRDVRFSKMHLPSSSRLKHHETGCHDIHLVSVKNCCFVHVATNGLFRQFYGNALRKRRTLACRVISCLAIQAIIVDLSYLHPSSRSTLAHELPTQHCCERLNYAPNGATNSVAFTSKLLDARLRRLPNGLAKFLPSVRRGLLSGFPINNDLLLFEISLPIPGDKDQVDVIFDGESVINHVIGWSQPWNRIQIQSNWNNLSRNRSSIHYFILLQCLGFKELIVTDADVLPFDDGYFAKLQIERHSLKRNLSKDTLVQMK